MTEKVKELTKNTIIPINLGLLLLLLAATWNLSGTVRDFKEQQLAFEKKLVYRWSFPMMREFARDLRIHNPDITVPETEEIRRIYQEIQ